MENNRKGIIAIAVTVAVLVVGVLGASYAYFAASLATNATSNVYVRANTVDTLTFTGGADMSLVLNQTNMAKGSSNITLTSNASTPKANLTAGNAGTATYCYDIVVDTTNNQATGQATGTMNVTCTVGSGNKPTSQTCGTLDITKSANSSTNTICAKQQIQAAAGASQENTYSCTVNFINYKDTDQTTLAGKLVYQGKVRLQRVAC